jgi:hypothetical protein
MERTPLQCVVDALQIRHHAITEMGNLQYDQSLVQDLFPSWFDPVVSIDTC